LLNQSITSLSLSKRFQTQNQLLFRAQICFFQTLQGKRKKTHNLNSHHYIKSSNTKIDRFGGKKLLLMTTLFCWNPASPSFFSYKKKIENKKNKI